MTAPRPLFKRWQAFLFEPETPYSLAALRIAYGLLAFFYCLDFFRASSSWFWIGQGGLPSVTLLDPQGPWSRPVFSLFAALDPSARLRIALAPLGLASMLCVAAGFRTRLSAFVSVLTLYAVSSRLTVIEGPLELLKYIGLALVFSPAGRVMSVDRALRNSALPPLCPVLSKRFLQFLLTTVYVSTVSWKLASPHWREGTAVYFTTHLEGFSLLAPPGLFEQRWVVALLTWATLVIELALGTLLWVKRIRKPLLVAGLVFHASVALAMDIPYFHEVMVSLYLLFVEEEDYLRLRARLLGAPRAPRQAPTARRTGRPETRSRIAASVLIALLALQWLVIGLPFMHDDGRLFLVPFSTDYKPFSLVELTATWPMFSRSGQLGGGLRVLAHYADGSALELDRHRLAEFGLGGRNNRLHFFNWSTIQLNYARATGQTARFVEQAGPVFARLMTRGERRPIRLEFRNWVSRTPDFPDRGTGPRREWSTPVGDWKP